MKKISVKLRLLPLILVTELIVTGIPVYAQEYSRNTVAANLKEPPAEVLMIQEAVGDTISTEETAIDISTVSGDGTGYTYENNTVTIRADGNYIITGTTASNNIMVADGVMATVTLDNVKITSDVKSKAPIILKGYSKVTILLAGENILISTLQAPGLNVQKNATLTIKGDGELNAQGAQFWPGIGSNPNGTIVIEHGTIIALGGQNSSGIGGSYGYENGVINITGGNVTAVGGEGGPGIGGGRDGAGKYNGNITISGAETIVSAKGSENTGDIGSNLIVKDGATVYLQQYGKVDNYAIPIFENCTITGEGAGELSGQYSLEGKKIITLAAINTTSPILGGTPDLNAIVVQGEFTVSPVWWTPTPTKKFLASTSYTATVTLTAKSGYTFTGLSDATINRNTATITENTGTTVTLSYEFESTALKEVNDITITTQPNQLVYSPGEALDLSGIQVLLTYNDDTHETVAFTDFETHNITTSPLNGTSLTTEHSGNPVTISCGDKTASTENLVVVKKVQALPPVITEQSQNTAILQGTEHNLSVVANTMDGGTLTYQWYENTNASTIGGNPINNATASTYTVSAHTTGTFYYYVEIANTISDNGDGGIKTTLVTSEVITLLVTESTKPMVTNVIPTMGGTEVSTGGSIVITFNEEIATTGTVSLDGGNTFLDRRAAYWNNPANNIYTIPYSGLAYSSTYIITIEGFVNVAGNEMAADNSYSFTTGAMPEAPEPATHRIILETNGGGTARARESGVAGTTIDLTAIPNIGYYFSSWQVISPAALAITGNSFIMPDTEVTIKAVFARYSFPDNQDYIDKTDIDTTADKGADVPAIAKYSLPGAVSRKVLTVKITVKRIERAMKTVSDAKDNIGLRFEVYGVGDYESLVANLDRDVLEALLEANVSYVQISSDMIDIMLDTKALTSIKNQTDGRITLSAIKQSGLSAAAKVYINNRPAFDIAIKDNKEKLVSDLKDGTATIGITYKALATEEIDKLCAIYVDKKGRPQLLQDSSYDNGKLLFKSRRLSIYGIGSF